LAAVGSISRFSQHPDQLPHEERVPTGRGVARAREGDVGLRAEPSLEQLHDAVHAQRSEGDDVLRPLERLEQQRALAARVERLEPQHHGHADVLEAAQQVRDPPQRGGVGPVRVVDDEQQGLSAGEVGGQPEQAVEHRL
jgi:hypothetical protein